MALSYEEQRLPNKLDSSDARSFSEQLLLASGFDKFAPRFTIALCNNGLSGAANYTAALTLVKTSGEALWKAAVDRVQGRIVEGTLSRSDDRMLYWARLTMTKALRQWKPDFTLTAEQRATLQLEFEKASRGQSLLDFPAGSAYKRVLVSGFDPFTLGAAGQDGDLNIRIGNPSGATILALDGSTVVLTDGTTAVIKTFILPVNYGPFIDGMQEDVLGPWFRTGSKRVDASVTMSQGRSQFDLEHYNGRYHFANFPGNDNLNPACSAGGAFPAVLDCDIAPPIRWLGYAAKPWTKDGPAQFTEASLPFSKLIAANTGTGVVNQDTGQAGGWSVVRNDAYTVAACTQAASDAEVAYAPAQAEFKSAEAGLSNPPNGDFGAAYNRYLAAQAALNALTPPSPLETNCAINGGGGNYLSNASAYRNTLMRDVFGLKIPAGHIHTPTMTAFGAGSDRLITDATFEGRRDSIVAQSRNLIIGLAKTLSTVP